MALIEMSSVEESILALIVSNVVTLCVYCNTLCYYRLLITTQ